jgi:tetraacyldisaccharide 4'-kinase
MHRATVLAIPFDDQQAERYLKEVIKIDRSSESSRWIGPVWRLHRRMQVPAIEGPVVAFCGIARPDQFFAGLESAGLHVASRIAFADHQRYVQHDIDCVLDAARTSQAVALVTTEKDRVRLAPQLSSIPARLPLETAGLRIEIEDEDAAIDWLLARVANGPFTP